MLHGFFKINNSKKLSQQASHKSHQEGQEQGCSKTINIKTFYNIAYDKQDNCIYNKSEKP